MKVKLQSPAILFLILSLFIPSCLLASPITTADPVATVGGTVIPPPTELTTTATLFPTDVPTATVYPPVFNPETLGDNRVLDSFILTRTDKASGCEGLEGIDKTETIGYIKEPFSGYKVNKFLVVGDEFAEHQKYFVGGRYYETNGSVDLLILLETQPDNSDYFLQYETDMREGRIRYVGILSAQFVGQEEFQGIPAYHFTFDQTNLREASDPSGTYKIETAQGDLYLAQDGNYVLYFHVKETGNVCPYGPGYFPGVTEFTQELSSINQLTEIAVPPEYLEPEQTLLNLDLLPLPAGATPFSMLRYREISWDTYSYTVSASDDEFLEFYKNLSPTSGWTVSHIGQVTNHHACSDPDQVCVIINKGDVQFILYHSEGGISADYDKEHVFSPQ